jgi:hypothetical protein
MKHKAQESLNYLESGFKFYSDFNTLQDLINCQLTKRELEIAICDLEAFEMEFKHQYMKDTLKRIVEKLKKQKEMWVSEDE